MKYSLLSCTLGRIIAFAYVAAFTNSNVAQAKTALIYNGKGACKDCFQAAALVAQRAGFETAFVGADGDQNSFKNISLYIQPGGLALDAESNMSPTLKASIKDFVSQGGSYFGICAGAFLAVSRMHIDNLDKAGLGFVNGDSYVYEKVSETPTVLSIALQGKRRDLFWYWGPYFKLTTPTSSSQFEITALNPDQTPVGFRGHFGKGKFQVIGVHPEAPQDWRNGVKAIDHDGLDYDLAVEMITWLTSPTQ